MSQYLVRKVAEHVYGYAWDPLLLAALVGGGLVALIIYGASLRHSRRVASSKGLLPGVLAAMIVPIVVLGLAPERYAPIHEVLTAPPTRLAGLYADLIGALLLVTTMLLAVGAWAIVGLFDEGLGGAAPKWHQVARLLLITGLGGGIAAGSAKYVERITRMRTLPVAAAAYSHPVHVGVAFKPQTMLLRGASRSKEISDAREPLPVTRDSGWRVASAPFTATRAGEHRARARYECELYGLWLEREVSFIAEEERGDPLFAPRLGDKWHYRSSTTRQNLVRGVMLGRAPLPSTQVWLDAKLEIESERVEDGLRYLHLKVTQHIDRYYFLLLHGAKTQLYSDSLELIGSAVEREKRSLGEPLTEHVPCRLSFLEDHGVCACAPERQAPFRPAGLFYCEGVDGKPRKTSGGDQLGLALASVLTGGIAAIAIGMSEPDSGYRRGLVLKSWTAGDGRASYSSLIPPEARPLGGDSPWNNRYRADARAILMRSVAELRRCVTHVARRQLSLFLVVDEDGAVLHAAPGMSAPADATPELCAASIAQKQKLGSPIKGPVAFELSISL